MNIKVIVVNKGILALLGLLKSQNNNTVENTARVIFYLSLSDIFYSTIIQQNGVSPLTTVFKTGTDIAKVSAGGALLCLGRANHQCKSIAGYNGVATIIALLDSTNKVQNHDARMVLSGLGVLKEFRNVRIAKELMRLSGSSNIAIKLLSLQKLVELAHLRSHHVAILAIGSAILRRFAVKYGSSCHFGEIYSH